MSTDLPTTGDGPAADDSTPATPPPAPAPLPTAPTPPPARPAMDDATRRNWAMAAHLGALVASVVTGMAVLGPLLVWLLKKDEDAWVAEHAREALNFQLTWLLGSIVGGAVAAVLALVTIGLGLLVLLPLIAALVIAWLVFVIKAGIAASNGQPYRYPLTIRMIS